MYDKCNDSTKLTTNEKYMLRCIELAKRGAGNVSPNPMVGCVIVNNNKIIGEGFHEKYGEPHAEVNAINAVMNPELLQTSALYVSLEPCAHYGITPPCSDLIISKKIRKVIVGTMDPFAKVAGKGIEKMRNAGIEVVVGVLENECRELNKRFFTFHQKQRPYILLKWAQTADGFIDINRQSSDYGEPTWITGHHALVRVHKMRAAEDAIIVGTNTAKKDNPALTVRHCPGKNPLRAVVDQHLRLSKNLALFDNSVETLVFNSLKNEKVQKTHYIQINFAENSIIQILAELRKRNILSLIVEGGKQFLESFISQDLCDEAHVYTGGKIFVAGIKAPKITGKLVSKEKIENDLLLIFKNPG